MAYTLRGDHRLLTVLSVVTILPNADLSESYIIRGKVIIPVDIKALWKDGDISQNVLLYPGDTIVIPEPLKKVVLLGEFKKPGRYRVDRSAKILEAIGHAGGFDHRTANLYMAYLARGGAVMPVNFKRLLDYGDMSQNILLHDDDIIYMPNINESKVYVLGEVERPKVCYFTDPLDLLEAISSAGGFKDTANRSQVVVVRGTPQRPKAYAVNVLDMMKGKGMERFYLEKNDTIYIPRTAIADWNVFMNHTLPTLMTTKITQEIVNEGWNP
jgi:polysaccharide export outer membrane protein